MITSINGAYNSFGVAAKGDSNSSTFSNKNVLSQAVAKNNKIATYRNTSIDTKKSAIKLGDRFEKSQTDKTIEQLYSKLDGTNLESKINYNKELGIYVVKMIDKKTGDIVKQIPSEAMVKVKEQIRNIIPAKQI